MTRVQRGQCRVVGTGELLKEVGSQLSSWGLSVQLAEWASIYMIHDAKRRFGGVGGKTQTLTLADDGKFIAKHGAGIPQKEYVLEGFARIAQLLLLSLDPSLTNEQYKDLSNAARTWFAEARRELRRIREGKSPKVASVVIQNRQTRELIKMFNKARRLDSQTSKDQQGDAAGKQ